MSARVLALIEKLRQSDPDLVLALRELVHERDITQAKLTELRLALDNPSDSFGHTHELPYVRMRARGAAGGIPIPSGAQTAVGTASIPNGFEVIEQRGKIYDPVTPNKITIPDAGVWALWANCVWEVPGASSVTGRELFMLLNNASYLCSSEKEVARGTITFSIALAANISNELFTVKVLRRGDFVELKAWQNTGGALNILDINETSCVWGAAMLQRIPNYGDATYLSSRLPTVGTGAVDGRT